MASSQLVARDMSWRLVVFIFSFLFIYFSFFILLTAYLSFSLSKIWLVEQDGIIPTRRVIRCQENFKKRGLQHIDKAKDLKWKINLGSYVQISIWIHFRIELELKYISSGRVSGSIDFIEVENPNKGCASEVKKMIIWKKIVKVNFWAPEP